MFQELEKPLSQILVQCVLTHQTSVCYWISAHGQRRVADNWWNSVKSIHITAMEKWKWLISKAALSAPRLTSHQLWQIQPASLVLECVCTGFIDMYLFFFPPFLSLSGIYDSWAVRFCTSRCKYILLSDWHPPVLTCSCPRLLSYHYILCSPYSAKMKRRPWHD